MGNLDIIYLKVNSFKRIPFFNMSIISSLNSLCHHFLSEFSLILLISEWEKLNNLVPSHH